MTDKIDTSTAAVTALMQSMTAGRAVQSGST